MPTVKIEDKKAIKKCYYCHKKSKLSIKLTQDNKDGSLFITNFCLKDGLKAIKELSANDKRGERIKMKNYHLLKEKYKHYLALEEL